MIRRTTNGCPDAEGRVRQGSGNPFSQAGAPSFRCGFDFERMLFPQPRAHADPRVTLHAPSSTARTHCDKQAGRRIHHGGRRQGGGSTLTAETGDAVEKSYEPTAAWKEGTFPCLLLRTAQISNHAVLSVWAAKSTRFSTGDDTTKPGNRRCWVTDWTIPKTTLVGPRTGMGIAGLSGKNRDWDRQKISFRSPHPLQKDTNRHTKKPFALHA